MEGEFLAAGASLTHSTPLPEADVSRTGSRAVVALITPALFSQPPPRPPGEEGGLTG